LSIIVTGANRHDATHLKDVLAQQKNKYPPPVLRRNKHLCADAAYCGEPARRAIGWECYIPHVHDRAWEQRQRRRHPEQRAHRWIVEVAHGWFNRFRKLLVRYEKLERSFLALNHLAAAIIVFRKIPMSVHIIYG
jgi:transposase